MHRLAALLVLIPSIAFAQGTPGPPLPMGMDMRKAPVGSVATYQVNMTGMPGLEQRYALVGRDGATNTLELATRGGMLGPATMILRVVLDADPAHKERIKSLVMQLGDNAPMELREEGTMGKDQFAPLDPRRLVRSEKVKVPAGTFTARHYRDKTPSGPMDVWVSDEAPPLGIVKLSGTVSQGKGAASYPVTLELRERGKDARAVVTRPPQSFDATVLQNQMTRALSGK